MISNHTLIGIDIGGTNMRVGLVEDSKIVELTTKKVNKEGSTGDIFNELSHLIESVINPSVKGIGIGVPGVVDIEKGIVYDLFNIPQWREIQLKSLLEDRFNIPVYVNNDANCFAAGEKYFGKAVGASSFVGLILGTGMGAGVVANDRLYEGKNCGAGEFGCIQYLEHNYEYYCSGQFFQNNYNITAYEAAQKILYGDAEAKVMYNEFGYHLGKALQTILYAYDPELIVLGGSVSKSFDFFKDAMYKSLNDFLFKRALKSLRIEVSEVQNVAIYGAASLYYNNMATVM